MQIGQVLTRKQVMEHTNKRDASGKWSPLWQAVCDLSIGDGLPVTVSGTREWKQLQSSIRDKAHRNQDKNGWKVSILQDTKVENRYIILKIKV